ncbi:unnamed protein product [Cladocopium goreaui]|uniref:Uncharacterized protein n=1 Tax=Cladocopium goreaui TaxID=2562237 RepID=A0A9P1G6F5_9DINO|nr:unnamed protein product [Cladocopium goreaui]|mmetsp:Transcript_787/g.1731  ORF Transcript_787/g.1731 Transcript_787/m.1731 type:complete len:139 (-) Transcript_787:183-599(-)
MLLSRAFKAKVFRYGPFLPLARQKVAQLAPQIRCFAATAPGAEKISKERPDSIVDEEMRAAKPRYPIIFMTVALVGMMFGWAPFLFGGVILGSVAEQSTTQAKAVGGQSERGDEVREKMKRDFAEQRAKEKEAKMAKE